MSKTPLFCTIESPAAREEAEGARGRGCGHERQRDTHADHSRRTQAPSPSGDIVATRQAAGSGPSVDEAGKAIKEVTALSKLDFPKSALRIDPDGVLHNGKAVAAVKPEPPTKP